MSNEYTKNQFMIIDCLYQNDCVNKLQSLTRRQLEKLTGLSIHTVIKATNIFLELGYIAEGVYEGISKCYYLTQKGIDERVELMGKDKSK
jgi:Fe2+ or Zn2+ uptake regulation protein